MKKKVLYHVNLMTAIEEAKARLQDTDIGFATSYNSLPSVQSHNVMVDLLFSGYVKEIFFENFRRSAEMLADFVGVRSPFRRPAVQGSRSLEFRNNRVAWRNSLDSSPSWNDAVCRSATRKSLGRR